MVIASEIRLTADQMGSLFEIAGVKGKQFEQQASSLFQSFISTMNSGMVNSLKQFGFTFSHEFENSISKMSNMEKKQAILNEILKQGGEQVQKLRGKLGETSDGFEQMDIAVGKLKSAMQSWSVVLAPIAGTLANIVFKMAEFISIRDKYSALSIQELKKIRDETQAMLDEEIEKNTAATNARAIFSNLRSDDPTFAAGGEYLSSEKEQALKNELKLLDEHTQKLEELEKVKKQVAKNDAEAAEADRKSVEKQRAAENAKRAAEDAAKKGDEEYLKRLNAKAAAEYEYQQALADTNLSLGKILVNSDFAKNALQGSAIAGGLFDPQSLQAVKAVLGTLPSIFNEIDQAVERVRLELLRDATSQYVAALREGAPAAQQLGAVLDQSGHIMGSVMEAAGGMGGTVISAARAMNTVSYEGIGKNLDTLKKKVLGVADAYNTWSIVMGAAGIGTAGKLIPSDQIGAAIQGETDKLNEKEVQRIEEFAQKMRINVRDAFEQGLADAKNVDDFLKNFGNNLKSQVQQALASALTQQIFNGAGVFNLGSLLGLGSTSLENTPAVGSGINWGNLGTSLAIGGAISFLTSPGRLFGGTVQHGTEAFSSSAGLNDQVTNALKARDDLLKSAVGVSAGTLKALQDLQFTYSSVIANKSGDGIFSKKTTTYETVGGVASANTLKAFAELSAKAQAEAAQHAFEISLTQLSDPAKALDMTIQDLRLAVQKLGNSADALPLQLQLAQAEAQKRANEISATGTWLDFALSSGSADALSVAKRFVGQGSKPDPVTVHTVNKTPMLFENADGTVRSSGGGSFSVANIDPYKIGGKAMLDLYEQQTRREFNLQIMQAYAANSPTEQLAYLSAKKDAVSDAFRGYEELLNTIRMQLENQSLSEADSIRLFEQFKATSSQFYAAKAEMLTLDLQMSEIVQNQAEESRQAAETAAQKAALDHEAALVAAKEALSKTLAFQDDWLALAVENALTVSHPNFAYLLESNIQKGQWTENADVSWLPNEFAVRKYNQTQSLELQKMGLQVGDNPERLIAYQKAELQSLQAQKVFFNDIAAREEQNLLDRTKTYEEQRAHVERYFTAMKAANDAELQSLQIQKQQQDEIARQMKEAAAKTLTFRDEWLALALNNTEVLGNQSYAYLLKKNIQDGTWTENSDTNWLPDEFNLRKEAMRQSFDFEKLGLFANDDTEKIKAYQDEQLKKFQAEKDFFDEIAAREEQNLLDRTKTYEEQRAHVERYFSAKKAANDAELNGLKIQKQQQDEITAKADELKAKQENMFYDLLGNLMTRVVQAQETKTGDTYNILAPGQTPAQRILEAMQATVNGKYPELAAVMKDIVAEFGGEYGI